MIESPRFPITPINALRKVFGQTDLNPSDQIALEASAVAKYALLATLRGNYFRCPEMLIDKLVVWMGNIPNRIGQIPYGYERALGWLEKSRADNSQILKWLAISDTARGIINSHPNSRQIWDVIIEDNRRIITAIDEKESNNRQVSQSKNVVNEIQPESPNDEQFRLFIASELAAGRIGSLTAQRIGSLPFTDRESVMMYATEACVRALGLIRAEEDSTKSSSELHDINFYGLDRFRDICSNASDSKMFGGGILLTLFVLVDRMRAAEQTKQEQTQLNLVKELFDLENLVREPLRRLAGFFALYPDQSEVNWLMVHDLIPLIDEEILGIKLN